MNCGAAMRAGSGMSEQRGLDEGSTHIIQQCGIVVQCIPCEVLLAERDQVAEVPSRQRCMCWWRDIVCQGCSLQEHLQATQSFSRASVLTRHVTSTLSLNLQIGHCAAVHACCRLLTMESQQACENTSACTILLLHIAACVGVDHRLPSLLLPPPLLQRHILAQGSLAGSGNSMAQ
jgi:hypothetical protein